MNWYIHTSFPCRQPKNLSEITFLWLKISSDGIGIQVANCRWDIIDAGYNSRNNVFVVEHRYIYIAC